MDSEFMAAVTEQVCIRGVAVTRFEFPYMQERRKTGKKRLPDRAPLLVEYFQDVVRACGGGEQIVVGGKSMGGRIASMLAAEVDVRGCVCLGYPFHPPNKPETLRTGHFADIQSPVLIIQGERDPFGQLDEVNRLNLPDTMTVAWLPDGDHDFKPRKKSGYTQQQHIQQAADWIAEFVINCDKKM